MTDHSAHTTPIETADRPARRVSSLTGQVRRSPLREWLATLGVLALMPVLVVMAMPEAFGAHPTLSATDPAQRGSTITVIGGGYEGRSDLELRWDDKDIVASAQPDERGTFEISMTVPADAALGEHNLAAFDPVRGFESRQGDGALASTIVTVVDTESSSSPTASASASASGATAPGGSGSPAASGGVAGPGSSGSGVAGPSGSAAGTVPASGGGQAPAGSATEAPGTAKPSSKQATAKPSSTAAPSATTRPPSTPPPRRAGDYLIISKATLLSLPTSGSAWSAMKSVADGSLGSPDLGGRDSKVAGKTLAAALVYARTGQAAYRDKVIAVLSRVPGATGGMDVLSLGRQLAGYVIAADLVDYRDASFVSWVRSIRTANIGGHSRWYILRTTSEDSANNWGTWAMASRIAASLYVGDTADVSRAAKVFAGWLGDRAAYHGFQPTADFDASWACNASAWTPVNPACGLGKDGAFVEDISRSGGSYPNVDSTGLMYSWEVMGGATLSADLLAHNGYPGVWSWSNNALLRAANFIKRVGGYPPEHSVSAYIGWRINRVYGVNLGPLPAAGYGRQFGYTDWLR